MTLIFVVFGYMVSSLPSTAPVIARHSYNLFVQPIYIIHRDTTQNNIGSSSQLTPFQSKS